MFIQKTKVLFVSLLFGTLLNAGDLFAQAPANSANTKHNVTTDQQSNAASDRAITQKIHRLLAADKSLSTNAHNIKIVASNGAVILKGPVNSEDEKQQVAAIAADVIDASKIDNQLIIKAQ